jgi:hypothetical protein
MRARPVLREDSRLPRRAACRRACLLLLVVSGFASVASAQQFPAGAAVAGDEPLFSLDTPVGAIDYVAGRGLRLGDTGFTFGGFTTVEADVEEGEDGTIELDGVNLLLLWEPFDPVRIFAEIEIGGLFTYDTGTGRVESDATRQIERLYGDIDLSDALDVRFGKYQTPVGIWNLVPAEPFTWTATTPVLVETAFDEHLTGAALFGSFYPGNESLDYWLYGQFMEPLDPPSDDPHIDSGVGGRLRYGGSLGQWALGASFLASEQQGRWNYLGGLDAFWRVGPFELQGEFDVVRGDIPDRNLWGFYAQGVYDLGRASHLLRRLYAVGRYEYFAPSSSRKSQIGDVGLAWIPRHFLIVKAGYRFADRQSEEVQRGFFSSISVLF